MKSLLAAILVASTMLLYDKPSWVVGIDSRTSDQWLAEAPGFVFAASHGNLIAIDSTTGDVRWESPQHPLSAPAVTSGTVAVATDPGLVFLAARDGRVLAKVRAGRNLVLASARSTVVALDQDTNTLCGYSDRGKQRWCRSSANAGNTASLLGLGGNLVAVASPWGWVFFDAASGKAVASAADADTLVGSDGRYVWFTVRDGGVKGLDLDTNRSVVMHNQIERGQVIAEHDRAVAVIAGRLTLIDLSTRRTSPLHIDGRWIGGPADGKIFIERSDGLYLQSLEATRAMRIATYASEARYVTSHRKTGYVGLRDGTVLVVDLDRAALEHHYATGCNFYEGITASGNTTIVHCDLGTQSRLVGLVGA